MSLQYVIKNYQNKNIRLLLYLIFAFVGYNLVFNIEAADGYRHAKAFEEYGAKSFSDFQNDIEKINSRETATLDYYVTITKYLISRAFSDYSFYFLFHALVFAFFFLKTFNIVYDEFGAKYRVQQLMLLALIFIMPLWQLNALRYPLALWVWSYGAIHYLYLKNYKYLIFMPLASLVHFGITPASGIFLLFILLGERTKIYFYAFVLTLMTSEVVSFSFIQESIQGFGGGLEQRADGYLSENYIEMRKEGLSQTNWYVVGRVKLFNYFNIFCIVFVYLFKNKIRTDVLSNTLLSFTLLYGAYINLIIEIPSFGGRQRWFLWILVTILAYRLVSLNIHSKFSFWVYRLGLFPVVLYTFVELRIAIYNLSVGTLFSNPILSLIFKFDFSIDDLILFISKYLN